MEPTLRDPRMKSRIMTYMMGMLYQSALTRLANIRIRLIQRNDMAVGNGISGFIYKGEYYRDHHTRHTINVNRLIPDLHPEMDEYLAEINKEIPNEQIIVKGYITKILNASDSPADYMQLFPECLLPAVEPQMRIYGSSPSLLSEPNIILLLKETEEAKNLAMQRMVRNLLE